MMNDEPRRPSEETFVIPSFVIRHFPPMLNWITHRFWPRLVKAFNQWLEDDGNMLATSLSYYMALSFFPLLLILISGVGIILRDTGWGQDARRQIIEFIADHTTHALAGKVGDILSGIETQAALGGPIGIVILLFTAITIFAQFDRAFDRIWNINQQFTWGIRFLIKDMLFYRFRGLVMLLVIGLLVIVTFGLGIALSALAAKAPLGAEVAWLWNVVRIFAVMLLNGALFTLIYKLLPKVRVYWREAAQGAALAAVLWEISRQLLALLLGNTYGAYGLVGSFVGVLLWVYFICAIIFFGAEYVRVVCQECDPHRPLTVPPADEAIEEEGN
jgi:membrane protein